MHEENFGFSPDRLRGRARIDHMQVGYRRLFEALLESAERESDRSTQDPRLRFTDDETWSPSGRALNTIHYFIAEELGLEDYRHLRVFSGLRQSADVHHGIDYWFIWKDQESGRQVMVTLDASKRQKDSFKADVLLTPRGAVSNPLCGGYEVDVPVVFTNTRAEENADDNVVWQSQAKVIAQILQDKMRMGDDHYGEMAQKLRVFEVGQPQKKITPQGADGLDLTGSSPTRAASA